MFIILMMLIKDNAIILCELLNILTNKFLTTHFLKCFDQFCLPSVVSAKSIKLNVWYNRGWNWFLFNVSWLLYSNSFGCQCWCVDIVWNTSIWFTNRRECSIDGFWVWWNRASQTTNDRLLWWISLFHLEYI